MSHSNAVCGTASGFQKILVRVLTTGPCEVHTRRFKYTIDRVVGVQDGVFHFRPSTIGCRDNHETCISPLLCSCIYIP